jgi:hypothetical protein
MTETEKLKLELLKSENPLALLIVRDDKLALRAMITWSPSFVSVISDVMTARNLEEYWACCKVDFVSWGKKTNLSIKTLRNLFYFLSQNNLLFPDGSISNQVRSMLAVMARTEQASLSEQIKQFTESTKEKETVNVVNNEAV